MQTYLWLLSLLSSSSVAHIFHRGLDIKGSEFCDLSLDLSDALCTDLDDSFSGPTCNCRLSVSPCGVKGSFGCTSDEYDPVEITVTMAFENTDGSLSLEAVSPLDIPLLPNVPIEVLVKSETTLDFTIPLGTLTDLTTYNITGCSTDLSVESINAGDLDLDVLEDLANEVFDDCTCNVEGFLPLPQVSFSCLGISFTIPPKESR